MAGQPEDGRRGTATALFNRRRTQFALYQIYRRVIEDSELNSHPNVLPIIRVSETLFPVCIMSPWMPDGNIAQYTQANPEVNRLMLVRAHRWWRLMGESTDYARNRLHKCAVASCTFMDRIFHMAVLVR